MEFYRAIYQMSQQPTRVLEDALGGLTSNPDDVGLIPVRVGNLVRFREPSSTSRTLYDQVPRDIGVSFRVTKPNDETVPWPATVLRFRVTQLDEYGSQCTDVYYIDGETVWSKPPKDSEIFVPVRARSPVAPPYDWDYNPRPHIQGNPFGATAGRSPHRFGAPGGFQGLLGGAGPAGSRTGDVGGVSTGAQGGQPAGQPDTPIPPLDNGSGSGQGGAGAGEHPANQIPRLETILDAQGSFIGYKPAGLVDHGQKGDTTGEPGSKKTPGSNDAPGSTPDQPPRPPGNTNTPSSAGGMGGNPPSSQSLPQLDSTHRPPANPTNPPVMGQRPTREKHQDDDGLGPIAGDPKLYPPDANLEAEQLIRIIRWSMERLRREDIASGNIPEGVVLPPEDGGSAQQRRSAAAGITPPRPPQQQTSSQPDPNAGSAAFQQQQQQQKQHPAASNTSQAAVADPSTSVAPAPFQAASSTLATQGSAVTHGGGVYSSGTGLGRGTSRGGRGRGGRGGRGRGGRGRAPFG